MMSSYNLAYYNQIRLGIKGHDTNLNVKFVFVIIKSVNI